MKGMSGYLAGIERREQRWIWPTVYIGIILSKNKKTLWIKFYRNGNNKILILIFFKLQAFAFSVFKVILLTNWEL